MAWITLHPREQRGKKVLYAAIDDRIFILTNPSAKGDESLEVDDVRGKELPQDDGKEVVANYRHALKAALRNLDYYGNDVYYLGDSIDLWG